MYRKIARNIAIVSALFIVAFSTMLITNYFQVRGFNPLQTEVIETLKQINDENSGNMLLQDQIRQLDLLARRAYFVRMNHLKTGVYILIGMLVVFIVTTRYYFSGIKDLPDKDIDPIDEWAENTLARKYINMALGGLVVAALLFALLSSPWLKSRKIDSALKPAQTNQLVEDAADSGTEIPQPEDTEKIAGVVEDSVPTEKENVANAIEEETPTITSNNFRGNNANGISAAKNIPITWDLKSGDNIAWISNIRRRGYNSPVINGNKIFLTGADEQARELYCYDLKSGELRWSLLADNIPGSPTQMPATTEDTGLAASTVTTNGKQVCAIFATGDLICADMEGKRLWAKNLGVPENHYGYASSLLSFGNTVIIQYDNSNSQKLLALDMTTGAQRWSKTRADKITWSSPSITYIDGNAQLLLMGNPNLTSYNPNNGEQNWAVQFLNGEVASSPCSSGGLVFGASEYSALVAIDAATGEKLWEANDYLPEVASPVATREHVYVATSYGVLACYDAKTGELRKYHETNTEFYSSPVITEGKIYLVSNSGKAFIYTANSEMTPINSFDTGQRTFATPAFTDGRMIVRTEKQLYCVSKK
jgi:outer membrane protein assembly factor BamB